jgi:hypothetical protein
MLDIAITQSEALLKFQQLPCRFVFLEIFYLEVVLLRCGFIFRRMINSIIVRGRCKSQWYQSCDINFCVSMETGGGTRYFQKKKKKKVHRDFNNYRNFG